jgi:hypothetical protein
MEGLGKLKKKKKKNSVTSLGFDPATLELVA